MIKTTINGTEFVFESTPTCFSPNDIDKGTLAMLQLAKIAKTDKVLDIGCGYGVVGIVAAKLTAPENVFMLDINSEAVSVAKKNASLNHVEGVHILESNAYDSLDESGFDIILSNPPYHEDFSVQSGLSKKGLTD